MIRNYNIADDAAIEIHKILGATLSDQVLTGELFWVGDNDDAAFDKMVGRVSPDHLFTDLGDALAACMDNRGDIIICMEGFGQSVIAAANLVLNVAGVIIIFLGSGTSHAKITFSTDVDADMDVDAADITLIRPKFVADIDSLTGPIDINATDFTMIGAEYHDADDIETIDAVIADSSATRLKINGYKYFRGSETGDLKQSHIQLNGCDDIDLRNIDIRGNFYVGNIENVTDEVLNARFKDWYLENLNATPKPALYLDAAATGSCRNVKLKIASGTTYANSFGKMSWDKNCEGFMGDGYAGEPLGAVLSTGIEGKVDVIDGYHDVPTADAETNAVMRDVVGNKTDAAINAATTTKTLMAYIKGILNELTVPAANNEDNAFINDVVGQKEDTAASGAVTTTDTLVAYIKQLVTAEIAVAAQILKIDGVTLAVDPVSKSLATYLASGGTALGTELADSKSIIDALGFNGSAFVAGGLGMYLPRCVEKSDGAVLSGLDDLFTITGGPIRCKIVGVVTTLIGGAVNLRLQHTTTAPAATVDLNAGAVVCDDDAVGTIYHNLGATGVFTPSGGLGFAILDPVTKEETEYILQPGTIKCLGDAAQDGVIKWYLTYQPLSPNSTVEAAA